MEAMSRVRGWWAGALALALWLGASAAAATPPPLFEEGNQDYQAGRYADAARKYQALITSGREDGVLFYNLGNALLKSDQPAQALWAYLNAKALRPRDHDVQANLAYTRTLLSDAQAVSVKPPAAADWLTAGQRLTTHEWALAWTVLLWAFCMTLLAWIWWPRTGLWARPLLWIAGLTAAIVFTSLVAQTVLIDRVPRAVVVERSDARFAPQDNGTIHFSLPSGTVVKTLWQQAGWVQIQRADGRSGWLPEAVVKPLVRGAS